LSFYGFNRPGVKSLEPVILNWWRQGMMGGAKAHYDGMVAFARPRRDRRFRPDFWFLAFRPD